MRTLQYWTTGPSTSEIRETEVPVPDDGEALIETLVSGVSRGTEGLVHRGEVPDAVAHLMRAPNQLGDLPHPVSHGYLNVGVVREGAEHLVGQRVFTLSGHRQHVVMSTEDCHVLPAGMSAERALLAGIAEVALNGVWEAQLTLADRVAVVGAGLVGLCAGLLAERAGAHVLMVDQNERRRALCERLGLAAAAPEEAGGDQDVVLHTSASAAGLETALRIIGDDGAVVELSWYGTSAPQIPLGSDFHARRLRILGVQVGEVASPKRLRRTRTERLATALGLLADERFDALITGRSPLTQLPGEMNRLLADPETILHVIDYPAHQHPIDPGEHL
ncbi:zinc-dependent alcohol dehydrogenase [Nesterenkonia populi]